MCDNLYYLIWKEEQVRWFWLIPVNFHFSLCMQSTPFCHVLNNSETNRSIHVVFFFSETLTPASVPPSFVHGFLYKHFFFNMGIWRLLQHAAQSIHMLLNEWVFLCLPYMFSFHLNSHDSQQCVQSTTPCTFLYRSPYCILLFPYVSLNGAYYWRTPLEVGIMCAQTYFLDAVS